MLRLNGDSIKMTRGDTAYFEITVYTPDGEIYELQKKDRLVFTVRETPKKTSGSPPLLEKSFQDRTIKLVPEDTNFLKYGKYFWDVEIIFANGDVNTVCAGTLTLAYEVS